MSQSEDQVYTDFKVTDPERRTAAKPLPAPASEEWTADEIAMLRFLEICVPSLDPDNFENVIHACNALCLARRQLASSSVRKCLDLLGVKGGE